MSSNLQSIVCCLGDPVAGNPTQFLMQRAAGTLGLDWMFVTSEVPEQRLKEAFQGIRALRFSGVAFLSPHQQAASQLVDSLTESALRSGQVRVARRDGDAWLGDDTLGMAIVELLSSQQSSPHLIISQYGGDGRSAAVEGDGHNHELSNELLFGGGLLCAGQPWIPHLIRLARPDYSSKIFQWDTKLEEATPIAIDQVLNSSNKSPEVQLHENESPALSIESSDLTSFGGFVIDHTAPPITSKQLGKLTQNQKEITAVFIQHNASWELAIQKLDVPGKRIYRSFDVAAAKATVNFQFWTGQSADFASIRDSLDEYCQW